MKLCGQLGLRERGGDDAIALERVGITDVFFELFDGTHSAIEYRYPLGLRYLAERLA